MKVKDKNALNINRIMSFCSKEIERFTNYITSNDIDGNSIRYEIKDESDFLLFEFLELDSIIENLNNCLDGFTVDDIETTDFEIIFKLK